MNREITNKVLQYLNNNIGYPSNIQDISTGVSVDNETVSAVIKKLYANHLAYYYDDYWYLTLEGKDYASGNTTVKRTREYYNQLKKFFADHGVEIHDWREVSNPIYQEWLDEFEKRINGSFRENHPELSHILNSLAPEAVDGQDIRQGPRKFHAQEWRADSMAHFLNYDFSNPEMQYPKEVGNAYKAPKDIRTIEQSMAHSLDRFYNNVDQMKPYFVNKDRYRELYESSNNVIASVVNDNITKIEEFKTTAPGTVVEVKSILKDVEKEVLDRIDANSDIEQSVISKFISKYVNKSIDNSNINGLLITSTESVDSAVRKLKSVIPREDVASVYTNFIKSSSNIRKDTSSIMNEVMHNADFSGKNFPGFNFNKIDISGAVFNGCDLSYSTWDNTSVDSCSFQRANLNNVDMGKIKLFNNNDITRSSFTDASLSLNVVSPSNIGTPTDMTITDIGTDADFLHVVSDGPKFKTSSIPIKPNEKSGVELLMRAIRSLLSNSSVVSVYNHLELKHIRKFNTMKIADMPPNANDILSNSTMDADISKQLLEFASDISKVPTFDFGEDLSIWAKDQAKRGNLKWLGKWVGKFIGNANQLKAKPEKKKIHIEDKDDIHKNEMIDSFVSKHLNENKTHIGEIFKLLEFQPIDGSDYIEDASNTYIGSWISENMSGETVTENGDNYVTIKDLHTIYKTLNITLNKEDELPQFPSNREYEHLPYSTDIFPINANTMGSFRVAGKGSQFTILLKPNEVDTSDSFMNVYKAALRNVGPHYDAIGFSRLYPIKKVNIDVVSKVNDNINVWVITEMQSDVYQKFSKNIGYIKSTLSKNGQDPNFANNFKSIIRHWAFNLLNVIISKANAADVDEIWMTRASDVAEKTSNSSVDWSSSYDIPAKAFGFKLEDVQKEIKIDPGSTYAYTSSQFYVLKLHGEEKVSALNKLATIDRETLDKYSKDLAHHTRWVLDNNRPKFEEVNSYVTDDMIAQFAWRTFFEEYNIAEEYISDPVFISKLKESIQEDMGFDIKEGPYIDWLHWYQKAIDDVNFFISNQKEITPDLNASDEELSQDWIQLWQEETVPDDIKNASWYNELFLNGIANMLAEKGYGDVFSTTYNPPPESSPESLLNFINNDTPGGELLYPDGEPIDPSQISPEERLELDKEKNNIFNDLSFDSFMEPTDDVVQEMTDELLDKLNVAINSGDVEEATRIRTQLSDLSNISSLKFTGVL